MPLFDIKLSDGRVVTLEGERQPTEEEATTAISQYEADAPTWYGAAGRAAATSALPTGVGMAAAAPLMPWATAAAPATYGASLLVPLVAGGIASALGSKFVEKPLEKKFFPELETMQQRDIQEQKAASMGGRLLAVAPFAEFAPGQALKGIASIPKALLGAGTQEATQLARRAAMGTTMNVGLQEAMVTGQSLITQGKLPEPAELGEAGLAGLLFGKMRGPLGKLAGQEEGKRAAATPPTRDQQAGYYQRIEAGVAAGGRKLNKISGPIPRFPNDVMHANEDGSIDVSLPQVDKYLHQYIDPGQSKEEAIDRMVAEELSHAAQFDLPEARAEAAKFWNDYTALEKRAARRIIMGERPTDPEAAQAYDARAKDDAYLGLESSRYWLQRMSKLGPTEMSALQAQGGATVRMMDRILAFVRRLREIFGTKASQRQKEYWESVEANAELAKKGAQDAIQKRGPEAVPVGQPPGDRGAVGTQVRKPEEPAEAQTAATVEGQEKVLLTPQQLHQKQNEVIEGLQPGEYVMSSAVSQGPMKPVAYGPHHPGILKDIGGEELVKQYESRESRENDMFGFRTNQRDWVPRSQLKVRKTGKPAHSDDIPLFGEKTVAEQPKAAVPPVAPKPSPTVKPTPTVRNPATAALFNARNEVQVLEALAAKDPSMQPALDAARARLAEAEEAFKLSRKQAPPVAPTKGAQPSQAPTGRPTTRVEPPTPVPGAISEATAIPEKAQGPAEQAWRAHDEEMRQKRDEITRADRVKNRELFKAALAENPDLGTEGAGVTMKGRSVPPYTKEEALEISMAIFPELPPKSTEEMVKRIVSVKPEEQDAYVNHLREQAEIFKEQKRQEMLKAVHDAEMKRRSQSAELQERIEAGTQRRMPIPPESMARLKIGLYSYFKDNVRPIAPPGQLRPESVGTTYGGKTKIVLPTVEPGPGGEIKTPPKIRFAVPDPIDWLENIIRNPTPVPGVETKFDPYVLQASDRQLLDLYDEAWLNYLRHAPSEDLVKLRQAHRLDRLDLRGDIPDPELDPLFRMLQNIRHGEEILPQIDSPAEEKLKAMARTQGVDTEQKGWEDELLKAISQKVAARLPDIALARNVDIDQPGWREKLFKGMLREARKFEKARLEYIEPAGGSVEKIIKLAREFNDANSARQRKRARLERMLAQRGSSDMFIARKNPLRGKITADDIWVNEDDTQTGSYAQFGLIKDIEGGDPLLTTVDWMGHGTKIGEKFENVYTPEDLADFNNALTEGDGGVGANATKRITLLYNTKTGDLDAVSTYRNDRTKKAMIYDPRGEPGRHDRDHLRITQMPGNYRIFGTMLVKDPVGYFHQRWSSDESGSGLKKFWFEIGELANSATEGDRVWNRMNKIRAARKKREAKAELKRRVALTPEEQRAQKKLELYEDMQEHDEEVQARLGKLEQEETDQAHADTKDTLEAEGKEQKDPEEFTVKELANMHHRLNRLQEMVNAGEIQDEDIGERIQRMSRMDEAAIEDYEQKQGRMDLVQQAQARPFEHNITHKEARNLAYLFYRFNIRTDSRSNFKKDMETVLGYLHDSLAQEVSGRNWSLLSAIKKIAAVKYAHLVKGKGAAEELKWYIEDHPALSKKAAIKKFYDEKQNRAFEHALEDIRDLHAITKAELERAQSAELLGKTHGVKESETTPDYPLFPDRFAQRVTEQYGDHAARTLEAMSVSPQHAAGRAVRQLTDAGRLGDINLPDWVLSNDRRKAKDIARWLKTGAGTSWLKSPEGQDFLKQAAAAIVSSKRITERLSAAKNLHKELTMAEVHIPRGKLPEPVFEKLYSGEEGPAMLPKRGLWQLREAETGARPPDPAIVRKQLAGRTDMHQVAEELSNLENRVAVPGVPESNRPFLRNWLTSPEGKKYLSERWGMRQKPGEKVEDLHNRLMQKVSRSVEIEEEIRGRELPPSRWERVDPGITIERTTPGVTMKEHVAGRRRREEQAAALGIHAPPKSEESMTVEELLELGPKKIEEGGLNSNPYQVRERVTRTGQVSATDASLLIYWDRQLQADADKIANDPQYGKNSPEYQAAEQDWLEWRDWEQKASGGTASELMRVRQGVQDLDTGSWTAMKRELRRVTRDEYSEEEEAYLEEQVNEKHDTQEGILRDEERLREEKVDLLSMPVTPEQEGVINEGKSYIDEFLNQADKGEYKRDEGAPMAMKGGKAAPLTPEERDSLTYKGIREMINLSSSDSLSEASWRKAMIKKYPSSAPFLGEIWGPAQQLRDRLVAKAIGADKNAEIARRVLTRNRPTPEESKAILARAAQLNKGTRNISTAEAIHAWNFIDQKYFDKMTEASKEGDFDTVLTLAAIDLGIPRERLYRSLIKPKSIRLITEDLYKKMDKNARLRAHIRNWIDQKEHPWLVNLAKAVPRVFFMDKIFGHGFVGMITHGSNLAFQPWAWKSYFGKEGGWATMYQMVLSDTKLGKKLIGNASVGFHRRILNAIETDPMYRMAKRAGLEVDPHRYHSDYDVGNWYRWLRENTGGRGFDALKKLRLDLFKTWWGSLEPELHTDQMAQLIANDVNHMTGIVHTRFPEWSNWVFFAPKLAAAQWSVITRDPLKAMAYLSHWKTSSPEQRAWAMGQLKHKAAMVGVYFAGLAVNQGILKVSGSSQSINAPLVGEDSDPKKSDFMAFKVGGFNVGLAGPLIQIVRLFSDMIHIGMGERSPLEKTQTRQARFGERLWEYGRRKMSPFASFVVDTASGQDFTGRPLPWSSDVLPRSRRMRGVSNYDWPEYALQTIAPIPVEEAVKEVWANLGMDMSTMNRLWHALAVAVPMTMTGARIWEDPYAEQEPETVKGPASAY